MTINNKYNIGDAVYLVTDPEQLRRIVIGILVREHGMMYHVSYINDAQYCYECELSDKEDIILKTS